MDETPATNEPPALGWWRYLYVVAMVMFWTSSNWASGARHFGYALWPLLLVIALFLLSPIVALAELAITKERFFKEKDIARVQYEWRRLWAFGLLANFAIAALMYVFE